MRADVPPAVLGKTPQASPNALGRASHQQHAIASIPQHQKTRAPHRLRAARTAHRECLGSPEPPGGAAGAHRATRAIGAGTRAQRGAEIHDGLRVIRYARAWRMPLSKPPEFLFGHALIHPSLDGVVSREHTLDVAIEDGMPLAVGQRQNGTRRGGTYARKMGNVFEAAREAAAVLARDDAGGGMEVARPSVVPETGPEMQHAVEARRRERFNIGKTHKEAFEVGDDSRDLRLLEHDFGNPDGIRIATALPRQLLAPVPVVPVEQPAAEGIAHGDRPAYGSWA